MDGKEGFDWGMVIGVGVILIFTSSLLFAAYRFFFGDETGEDRRKLGGFLLLFLGFVLGMFGLGNDIAWLALVGIAAALGGITLAMSAD
ncbi:MAG: hypothetical protein V3S11_04580 [Elusimicrobiota bacterium]